MSHGAYALLIFSQTHSGDIKLVVKEIMALERSERQLRASSKQERRKSAEAAPADAAGFVVVAAHELPRADTVIGDEPAADQPAGQASIPVVPSRAAPPVARPVDESAALDISLGCSVASCFEQSSEVAALPEEEAASTKPGHTLLPREGLLPASMCQLCGRGFFGVDYNAPWFGLAGCRRGRCQHCFRSVCDACSSNTLPLRVANIQEKVCDSCFDALRGTALSAVEAREQHTEMLQAERRRAAQQQENQRLRRRVARVKREAAAAKLLYAGAEEAKVRLRPRHDAECARVHVSNVLCPTYLA